MRQEPPGGYRHQDERNGPHLPMGHESEDAQDRNKRNKSKNHLEPSLIPKIAAAHIGPSGKGDHSPDARRERDEPCFGPTRLGVLHLSHQLAKESVKTIEGIR